MRRTKLSAAFAAILLAGSLAACGDAGDDDDGGTDVEAEENAADNFDDGTRMKELAEAGEITVGVKFDQPGLGFKGAADDLPSGFDVEIAKFLVADLGIDPEDTRRSPTRRPSPTTASRSSRRARSTWCSRRTPSPTSVARSSARPAPTSSPASRCWCPPTATSQASRTSRARRSAR